MNAAKHKAEAEKCNSCGGDADEWGCLALQEMGAGLLVATIPDGEE